MSAPARGSHAWESVCEAACLFAVDPHGLGGVVLRSAPGPVRDLWLDTLRALLPASAPWRRVPLHITDDGLFGGLDLAATLRSGHAIAQSGVLSQADGGVVILAMAERAAPGLAARLAATLDMGAITAERDGFTLRRPARFGLVALDEGASPDERAPGALLDRLAFAVTLDGIGLRETGPIPYDRSAIIAARQRLPVIDTDATVLEGLCAVAASLGIFSLRMAVLAARTARAAAALNGRRSVTCEDAATAARLVLAPRAIALPEEAPPEGAAPPKPADAGADEADHAPDEIDAPHEAPPLEDVVLAAVRAAVPADLLATLSSSKTGSAKSSATGRADASLRSQLRGRPIGVRAGLPCGGARLSVIETLRAAAPWQALRGRGSERIALRREDFRVIRFKAKARNTTIFAVDASGSAASQRLAEAKGAIERLLADCYVRRDQVALLAFRGQTAELIVPPTGALARARKCLAGLPGGGGTPLAAGIDAARMLAESLRRRGERPFIVMLTDGRANIARDGRAGRAAAASDAVQSARAMRSAQLACALVDISPRPDPSAARLASEMGARHVMLPSTDGHALSQTVRALAAARP